MQNILLIPTNANVGLTSACLGLIQAFEKQNIQTHFLKPFSQKLQNNSNSTAHLYSQLLNRPLPQSISHDTITHALALNQTDDLLEDAILLNQRQATQQFTIIEGLYPSETTYFAHNLNQKLAQAFDAKVVFVSQSNLTQPKQLTAKIHAQIQMFHEIQDRLAGVLLMRTQGWTPNTTIPDVQPYSPLPIIGLVPFSSTLSVPRTTDILSTIDGTWIHEGQAQHRRILNCNILTSTIEHELQHFTTGELLISSADRTDVLFASAIATDNNIKLAGLVLTEREVPNHHILTFCEKALQQGLPIIHTTLTPFETAQRLKRANNEIPMDDTERAKNVMDFVSSHVDCMWIQQFQQQNYSPKISPAVFRSQLVQKAISNKKTIVLPEGDEPRTIEAAIICQKRGIADCILLACPEKVHQIATHHQLNVPNNLKIIDPATIYEQYTTVMVEKRKGKLDIAQAKEQLQDTVVLGTMMLALDQVDGLVSGAVHTTANTVRPAFQLIKTAPEYSLVSSIFFMLLPNQVYVYGDCAINPDPTAEQLAEIAIQSADSAKAFGIEPHIAMISYSTGTSGAGDDVEKVATATQLVQQKRPDLNIDGPLQYDAASVEHVGRSKAPRSKVAGHANVFIFPDLNTGNTTYKAVQRSANVLSVGPMLQGLNKPVNDLSRGALVEDIVFTIALTAIQAQS